MLVELEHQSKRRIWINPKWVSAVREESSGEFTGRTPYCYVDTGVDEAGVFRIFGTAAEIAAKLNAAEEKSNAG